MNRIGPLLLLAFALAGGAAAATGPVTLRLGHFPNLTHAHALVARALAAEGRPWFEPRLPAGTVVIWSVYNAGPSATEAIFARALDATYIGPNPAINAHLRSRGDEIRVISGAMRGGAGLVVQGDGRITAAADFRGRRLATPQLGNTQDVAARAWLTAAGLRVTLTGGDAEVIPTRNPDQLNLFQKGDVDGVWTVEPWLARLELEAGGRLLFETPEELTTILVVRVRFAEQFPEVVARLRDAHRELAGWIRENPAEAKRLVQVQLRATTGRELPGRVLERAWPRLRLVDDVAVADFALAVEAAAAVGLLPGQRDVSRIIWSAP